MGANNSASIYAKTGKKATAANNSQNNGFLDQVKTLNPKYYLFLMQNQKIDPKNKKIYGFAKEMKRNIVENKFAEVETILGKCSALIPIEMKLAEESIQELIAMAALSKNGVSASMLDSAYNIAYHYSLEDVHFLALMAVNGTKASIN